MIFQYFSWMCWRKALVGKVAMRLRSVGMSSIAIVWIAQGVPGADGLPACTACIVCSGLVPVFSCQLAILAQLRLHHVLWWRAHPAMDFCNPDTNDMKWQNHDMDSDFQSSNKHPSITKEVKFVQVKTWHSEHLSSHGCIPPVHSNAEAVACGSVPWWQVSGNQLWISLNLVFGWTLKFQVCFVFVLLLLLFRVFLFCHPSLLSWGVCCDLSQSLWRPDQSGGQGMLDFSILGIEAFLRKDLRFRVSHASHLFMMLSSSYSPEDSCGIQLEWPVALYHTVPHGRGNTKSEVHEVCAGWRRSPWEWHQDRVLFAAGRSRPL